LTGWVAAAVVFYFLIPTPIVAAAIQPVFK